MEVEKPQVFVLIKLHRTQIVAGKVLATTGAMVVLGVEVAMSRHAMEDLRIFNPSAFVQIDVTRLFAMRTCRLEATTNKQMGNPTSHTLDIKAASINQLDERGASTIFGIYLPPVMGFEICRSNSIHRISHILDKEILVVAIWPVADIMARWHGAVHCNVKQREES